MKAPLIFCSTSHAINVQKIFKASLALGSSADTAGTLTMVLLRAQIILSKAFDLKCTIPEIKGVGEPLLIYVSVALQTVISDQR